MLVFSVVIHVTGGPQFFKVNKVIIIGIKLDEISDLQAYICIHISSKYTL